MNKLMIGAASLALLVGCDQIQGGAPGASDTADTAEVTVRAGNPALAADALAAMSLDTSGAGLFSFADKTVDGATATFTDVGLIGSDDLVAIGSVVMSGLDVSEDGQANFGQLSLNNISFTSPIEDEAEAAEVNLGSIELTNPSPELAAWIADLVSDGQPDAEFPDASAIAFDSWSISDLSGAFSDDADEGNLGIESFTISGVENLKAAEFAIGGVSFDMFNEAEDLPVTLSLGSFGVSNVDASFLEAIQENIGDQDAMMGAVMSVIYDNPMDPGYDGITLTDLKGDVGGASFEMPSLASSVERNAEGQPIKYKTEPYSLKIDANPDGGSVGAGLLEGLSVIGFESLELNGASEASYDPDADIVTFGAGKNFIELVDGAKFSVGGKIEGYNAYSELIGSSLNVSDLAAGYEPSPDAMVEALGALTFHDLEIAIADDSLLNRVLNAVATDSGMDPEEMKNQAAMGLGMAPMFLQGSGVDMGLVTEATSALSSFLQEPGTLTFKLDPDTPLSIAAFMENPDPTTLTKDSLGFSATNE